MGGQVGHGGDDGVADRGGAVAVGQVQQQGEAGGAFDEGADGGPVLGAGDQVAFPVAGHGPVGDLGRPVGDHDHVRDAGADRCAGRRGAGFAQRPPGAQAAGQLPAQRAPALDVEGSGRSTSCETRIVGVVGKQQRQPAADLLGAHPLLQHRLDLDLQPGTGGQPPGLGSSGPFLGLGLCQHRTVARPVLAQCLVAAELLTDRGRGPAQAAGDAAHALPGRPTERDLLALGQVQVPAGGLL